jgi:ABC-2 type transport system ATP-binding protein
VRQNLYAAARLHGLPRSLAPASVQQVVAQLELSHWADRRCATLSLGNRQRVGLGCALVHRPDVLVLDEPANSLDPAGVVLVRDLLRHEADRRGLSVLVSSHHLDEVARIADRISVLHRGRLVGALDPGGVDLERAFFALVHAADTHTDPHREIR